VFVASLFFVEYKFDVVSFLVCLRDRMIHLFCDLLEEFVLGEVGDEEETFLRVHFLEGVFVAIDGVTADIEVFRRFASGSCA